MVDILKYKPIQQLDTDIIGFSDKLKSNMNEHFDNQYENMIVKFIPNFSKSYFDSRTLVDRFIAKQIISDTFKANKKKNKNDEEEGDLSLILEDAFAKENKNFLLIIPTNISHEHTEYRNRSDEEEQHDKDTNPWYKGPVKYKKADTGHFIEFLNKYIFIFCSSERKDVNNFYYMLFHTIDENKDSLIELIDKSNHFHFDEYEFGNQKLYNLITVKVKSTYKIKIKQ